MRTSAKRQLRSRSAQGSAGWITDSPRPGSAMSGFASRNRIAAMCSEPGSQEPPSGRTYAESLSENQRGELLLTEVAHQLTTGGGKPGQGYQAVLLSSPEAPHAKISASPDAAQASSAGSGQAFSSSSPGSSPLFDREPFSWRTSPVSSRLAGVTDAEGAARFYAGISAEVALELAAALNSRSTGTSARWRRHHAEAAKQRVASSNGTTAPISPWCAPHCENSGTESPTGFSTAVSSECRSDADGCSSSEPSLTMILEPPQSVPGRYSLSARAARGILRRAEKRGRTLPPHLAQALVAVAAGMPTPTEPP
jgi:hypothetical protein